MRSGSSCSVGRLRLAVERRVAPRDLAADPQCAHFQKSCDLSPRPHKCLLRSLDHAIEPSVEKWAWDCWRRQLVEIGALGTILSIKGQVAKLYLQGQGLDWGRRCGKWRAELKLCSVVRYLIAGSSTDCCRGVTYTSTLLMYLPLPHTQKRLVTSQLDISREGRIGKTTEGSNDLFSLLCHGRSVALGSIRHSSREMWSLQIVIGISSNKYWNSSPPNQARK